MREYLLRVSSAMLDPRHVSLRRPAALVAATWLGFAVAACQGPDAYFRGPEPGSGQGGNGPTGAAGSTAAAAAGSIVSGAGGSVVSGAAGSIVSGAAGSIVSGAAGSVVSGT